MRPDPMQQPRYGETQGTYTSAALVSGSAQVEQTKAIVDLGMRHESNLKSALDLEQRIAQALSRLGVQRPLQPPSDKPQDTPSGHLPQMGKIAEYTAMALERLHALLTELERCI